MALPADRKSIRDYTLFLKEKGGDRIWSCGYGLQDSGSRAYRDQQ
jgi:hypothetical protein